MRDVSRAMKTKTNTATALLGALRLAREHGGAEAALRSSGIDMRETEQFGGLSAEVEGLLGDSKSGASRGEAFALGYLAGRVAIHPRLRTPGDPTSFVMDRELVVQGAEGESILRLPWFEDGLFVGRQLPDICEMPSKVRNLCVKNYLMALAGERSQFAFTSYGHSYSVDAVPVQEDGGKPAAVLAVAVPTSPFAAAATAYEQTAERLDRSAALADQRAELHGQAGRGDQELTARRAAQKAREAAERTRANAQRLRLRVTRSRPSEAPSLTPREVEVLQLASHGLTYSAIAEQLAVSAATIKTHLENAYPKLNVSDKAAAVAAALRHGLIE
jgi:DNA-binding CsgD family transcriptional regulator